MEAEETQTKANLSLFRRHKRLIIASIAVLVIVIPVVLIGGRRAEAAKLAKRAETSLANGNYSEALEYYKKSAELWKSPKAEDGIVEVQSALVKIDEYDTKVASIAADDYTQCIEYAKGISADHPRYSQAQTKLTECQTQETEKARIAAEREAQLQAEAKVGAEASTQAKQTATSSSSQSSASTSPSSSQTSSSSSTSTDNQSSSSSQSNQSTPTSTTNTPSAATTESAATGPDPAASPNLKNLGLNFAAYNAGTGMAGDFRITWGKVFYEYGAAVMSPTGTKYLHELTYHIPVGTNVISPLDGVVTAIRYQADTTDYEVDISPFSGSEWFANLDHLIDLAVATGDTVSVGDLIGKPQELNDNPGTARVELALLRNTNGEHRRYCPLAGMDSSTRSTFAAKIAQLISDSESFNGDTSLYDESAFNYVSGCTSEYVVDG